MAALTGKEIRSTYKDLLTVSGTTLGEGLESSVKRVFDGEGVGSPLWLGSNTLEFQGNVVMGSALSTGNYDFTLYGDYNSSPVKNPWVKWDASAGDLILNDVALSIKSSGTITTPSVELFNSAFESGAAQSAIGLNSDGEMTFKVDINTKKNVKFTDDSGATVELKPATGILEKGTDKGKIKLGDTSVTLQKGSSTLLEVKDDGSLALAPQGTAPDANTSSDGDIYVDDDGNLNIFQT